MIYEIRIKGLPRLVFTPVTAMLVKLARKANFVGVIHQMDRVPVGRKVEYVLPINEARLLYDFVSHNEVVDADLREAFGTPEDRS